MSLTVREKEHWKERIAKRINHAIEELQAKEDPGLSDRIRQSAGEEAWKSLGLKSWHDECAQIEDEMERLKRRQREVWAEMLSHVSGTPVRDVPVQYSLPREIETAVGRRKVVHEWELLSTTSLGKKILRLRQEKEELLDTVWLATSPVQIKELWSRFVELLNWEPTPLQKEALSIKPPSDPS